MRKLRDREHEHQIEEQLDERDVMVVALPDPQVAGACPHHLRHLLCRHLIASGLTGEPTAPVIGIAGATNRNS